MSYRTGPKIVTDGLVLCLDAGDRNSYPLSGNIWYDLSGNNNHFTLENSTWSSINKGALSIGNNIRIYRNSPVFSSDNNITIMVFTSRNFSFLEGNVSAHTRNFFRIESTTAILDQYGPSGAGSRTNLTYTNNVENKIITHKIASNRTANWFYNGSFFDGGTDETYESSALTWTEIGNRTVNGNPNYYTTTFNGDVSIVLCYTRELSDDEILQNYNALKGRFGL